jgi:hypothetical protein
LRNEDLFVNLQLRMTDRYCLDNDPSAPSAIRRPEDLAQTLRHNITER